MTKKELTIKFLITTTFSYKKIAEKINSTEKSVAFYAHKINKIDENILSHRKKYNKSEKIDDLIKKYKN